MDDKNQTDDSKDQTVDPTTVPVDAAAEEPAAEAASEKEAEEAPAAEEVAESPVAEAPAASTTSSEPAGTDQQGRQLYTVKCSTCGNDTQVPFQPTDGRPVYC